MFRSPDLTRSGSKASYHPRRLHHHNKYYHLYDGGGRHHNHSESRHPLHIVAGIPQLSPKYAYRVGRNGRRDIGFESMLNAPTVWSYPPDGYPEQTGRRKALCVNGSFLFM